MSTTQKVLLYGVGLILASIATVYQAHPTAPLMAYIASSAGSLGAFLVGAFAVNTPKP